MSNSLELPGMAAERLRRFEAAGFTSIEALLRASPEQLATLPGISAADAQDALALARRAMPSSPLDPVVSRLEPVIVPVPAEPRLVTLPSDPATPGPGRLGRGLHLARCIEATAGLVQQAREHARAAAASRGRWRTRHQLKRLHRALQRMQEDAISLGLGSRAHRQAGELIAPLEAELHAFLAQAPRKQALKQLRGAVKGVRRKLESQG